MDPEDLQTRLNQEIITTSDPRKMLGMYTAKRVLRTWTEDFIDQDTGELVTIERNDVIMERGVLLSIQNLDATQDQVEDGVDVYCQTFLLKSANADSAKKQIELYMARKAKERAETGKEAIICKYGITINAASPVGIGSVVPEDFSEAYKHAESDFAKEVEKKDTKEEDEDENSEE